MTVFVGVHAETSTGEIYEMDVNPDEIALCADRTMVAAENQPAAKAVLVRRGMDVSEPSCLLWILEDRVQWRELVALAQLQLARRETVEAVEVYNRRARDAPTFHCRFR